jgi:hypothetical protein
MIKSLLFLVLLSGLTLFGQTSEVPSTVVPWYPPPPVYVGNDKPVDFVRPFAPAGTNNPGSTCRLASSKAGFVLQSLPLITSPPSQVGVSGGGPYMFSWPAGQFSRYSTVYPVVSTTLWGDGPTPYPFYLGNTLGFNNPSQVPFEPPVYEQFTTGKNQQFVEESILSTAIPNTTNSCILTQGVASTSRFMVPVVPYSGRYSLGIVGLQTCSDGQQINGKTGKCVAKNPPLTSAVTTFCSGKTSATNACVDGSGNISALLAGTNGPCSNNLTEQPEVIACQLVNGTAGTTSTPTGGGGGVVITWGGGLGGGGNGCAPDDPNCPCYVNFLAPVPCSWTTEAGINPKTGRPFTATNTPTEVPAAPIGALDQDGIYISSPSDELTLTGWVASGASLIPNGISGIAPISLYRDPWCVSPGNCESGLQLVTTSWATEEPNSPVRPDIQKFLTNWPDVKFFALGPLTSLLPTGYLGNLEVHAQDVNGNYGLIGRTFYAQGKQFATPPIQVGAAATQISNSAGSQVITIPVHGNLNGINSVNQVVFSIQQTGAGGGPSSVGTCYGEATPQPPQLGGTYTEPGTIYLINDNGQGWKGSAPLQQPINLSNSQCTITYANWTNIGAGQDGALSLTVNFPSKYAGQNLLIFAFVTDTQGDASGWFPAGYVNVSPYSGSGPWVASVSSGAMNLATLVPTSDNQNPPTLQEITLNVQALDNTGTANQLYVRINYWPAYNGNGCNLSFIPSTNQVWLQSDSGNVNLVGTIGTGSLSNSQCTVDLANSSGGQNEGDIVFAPSIIFSPNWGPSASAPYTNHKAIYTYVTDSSGSAGIGWQPQGVLILP